MTDKPFDKDTTISEILSVNPALLEVFEHWGVHLVPATVTAMLSPLHKAAGWNAIADVNGLLAELNERRGMAATHEVPQQTNGHSGKK